METVSDSCAAADRSNDMSADAADAAAFACCLAAAGAGGGVGGLRSMHVNWWSSGVNCVCVMYVKSCVTLSSSPYDSVRSSAQSFCSFCVHQIYSFSHL